jgi:CheY-like chemotaxis protein
MTGVIAADKIRETCGKDIPVVIITSDVSPKVLAETEARGYSVLEKPVSPGRLRALLTHYFQPE